MIEFKDNQPTLDLLEAKGTGVFAMIDEELSVPKGTDETMLKKMLTKHAKHPNFAAPKPKDLNAHLVFIIVHYAGAVPYNVSSFLEKNRDALSEDILEVCFASKCPLISRLLRNEDEEASSGAGKAKKKQPTLGFQFKTSLEGLMVSLYRCEPHFVRCMKSNHLKKGNVFQADMMMAQLRYCGLLEVVRGCFGCVGDLHSCPLYLLFSARRAFVRSAFLCERSSTSLSFAIAPLTSATLRLTQPCASPYKRRVS